MEDSLQKKMEDDLKKNENGRRPQFFFENLEWQPQKNGTKILKMEEDLKKKEDGLKKIK